MTCSSLDMDDGYLNMLYDNLCLIADIFISTHSAAGTEDVFEEATPQGVHSHMLLLPFAVLLLLHAFFQVLIHYLCR